MSAQSILFVYLLVFTLNFIWEMVLVSLNMGTIRVNLDRIPEALKGSLDPQSYHRSVDYTLTRSRFGLVSSTATAALLLVFILTGWLGAVDRWVQSLSLGVYLQGILFVYLVSVVFGLFGLPFSLYSQFVIEQRFGFNRMPLKLYFLDQLKNVLLSLVLFTPLLFALFWFMDRSGTLWWLWAFLVFIAFQLGVSLLYPTVIAPLFNTFTPLEEGPLKEKISTLSRHLNFAVGGLLVMDGSRRSKHSNAYFTGFGRVKRVVLFDTLIKAMEENQIVAVLAHEIGHQKKHHVLKALLLSALFTLAALWLISLLVGWEPFFTAFRFDTPSIHAALVLFVFFSGPFSFFLKPVFSLWSRQHEYQADRFAAEALGRGQDLQTALLRLSRDNLSNVTPNRLYSFVFYSHPTLLERIEALDRV